MNTDTKRAKDKKLNKTREILIEKILTEMPILVSNLPVNQIKAPQETLRKATP